MESVVCLLIFNTFAGINNHNPAMTDATPRLTPRPGILDIAPYVGGEASAPGARRLIRLASNEGALGPSPRAVAAMREAAAELHRYPDGGAADLRLAIGRRFDLDPDRIVCGAGSDDLITLLTRAYAGPGDEVIHTAHGFAMYPINARSVGATPVAVAEKDLTADIDAILAAVTERTRIVFLANPNNPTGTYIPAGELNRLAASLPPSVLFVVDAAYAEYITRNDYASGAELVDRYPNVVMLRTFSKIFALGGLRLGWGYVPPGIADVMARVRNPFNVSATAQIAGIASVEDTDFVERSRRHNDQCRSWFTDRVRGLGLEVTPSVGNFVLVTFDGHDAEAARQFLKSEGVLVRQMGGYGLPRSLRISIGLDEEMEVVADLLGRFLAQAGTGS